MKENDIKDIENKIEELMTPLLKNMWVLSEDGRTPRKAASIQEVNEIFDLAKGAKLRTVGKDEVNGVKISTMFLSNDHSRDGGTPILFETMIFGGRFDQYCRRYSTWDEAELGHDIALMFVEMDEE